MQELIDFSPVIPPIFVYFANLYRCILYRFSDITTQCVSDRIAVVCLCYLLAGHISFFVFFNHYTVEFEVIHIGLPCLLSFYFILSLVVFITAYCVLCLCRVLYLPADP